MASLINGLHHVTAIASDHQQNIDFYVGILGLRLVKKTINFDAPEVYHLYYGDGKGNPGTLMTFFPYGAGIRKGRKGTGQITTTSFSIGPDSLSFWIERFNNLKIPFYGPNKRHDEEFIAFEDFDRTTLELVATDNDDRQGWETNIIPQQHAIKGFYSILLNLEAIDSTSQLLMDVLEHKPVFQKGSQFRFESGEGGPGTFVDLLLSDGVSRGTSGAGSIHHVAFRSDNADTQLEIRKKVEMASFSVTEVLDRQYFESIYFREPGGVLFEVATDPPGFLVDESLEDLGSSLKLPKWQEGNRDHIERMLKPIKMPVYT